VIHPLQLDANESDKDTAWPGEQVRTKFLFLFLFSENLISTHVLQIKSFFWARGKETIWVRKGKQCGLKMKIFGSLFL
jgi:hypothetical protein